MTRSFLMFIYSNVKPTPHILQKLCQVLSITTSLRVKDILTRSPFDNISDIWFVIDI